MPLRMWSPSMFFVVYSAIPILLTRHALTDTTLPSLCTFEHLIVVRLNRTASSYF
jgi:hypothetical protein